MRIFYTIFLLTILNNLFAQNQTIIDSLSMVLATTNDSSKMVDIRNDLSWELRNLDREKAFAYLDEAEEIARLINYKKGKAKVHLQRGAILVKTNQNDSAIAELIVAKTHYQNLGNTDKIASCLYNIGSAYNKIGDFEKSISFFKQALVIYKQLNRITRISSCVFNLGILHENLNEYEHAIQFYNQALEIDIELQDSMGIATSYSNIGNVYESWANYTKAIDFYNKAEHIFEKLNSREGLSYCYNNKGNLYSEWGNYNKAIKFYHKALNIDMETGDSVNIAGVLTNIAAIHDRWGDFNNALNFYEEAMKIAILNKNKPIQSMCHSGIGQVYLNKGNYDLAVTYYQKALDINKLLKNRSLIADDYLNIGNVHQLWENFDIAIKYYNDALLIFKELNEREGVANSLFALGSVYNEIDILGKSIDFFKNAKNIATDIKNYSLVAECLHHLGLVYTKQEKHRIALYHFSESLKLFEQLNEKGSIAENIVSIAQVKMQTKNYTEAITYFNKGLKIAKNIGKKQVLSNAYEGLANCYEKLGKTNKALNSYKYYKIYNDSLYDIESKMTLNQIESKFELQSKEQEIELQKTQLATKDLKIKQQRILRNVLILGVFLSCLIIVLIIIAYVQKQRSHKLIVQQKNEIIKKNKILEINEKKILLQNKDLQEQNHEILAQSNEIEEQQNKLLTINAEVSNSINYAERIQRSMLPPDEQLAENFSDYFIFYEPRDVVSGDFYWFKKIKNFVIIAAVDCTGHGVPGAFMSMLGLSFLNEIVSKSRFDSTDLVLNRMRDKIKKALNQKGAIGETRDGMDMAIITVNLETNELQYSGAYNPLYIIRDNKLLITKADKQPIAIYEKETPFNAHNIQLKKDDCIYLFTDGYADQFGGPDSKKFMSRQFKKLLLDIHQKPFEEQKTILNQTIVNWRGGFEQMDDLLVMGFKAKDIK